MVNKSFLENRLKNLKIMRDTISREIVELENALNPKVVKPTTRSAMELFAGNSNGFTVRELIHEARLHFGLNLQIESVRSFLSKERLNKRVKILMVDSHGENIYGYKV